MHPRKAGVPHLAEHGRNAPTVLGGRKPLCELAHPRGQANLHPFETDDLPRQPNAGVPDPPRRAAMTAKDIRVVTSAPTEKKAVARFARWQLEIPMAEPVLTRTATENRYTKCLEECSGN